MTVLTHALLAWGVILLLAASVAAVADMCDWMDARRIRRAARQAEREALRRATWEAISRYTYTEPGIPTNRRRNPK